MLEARTCYYLFHSGVAVKTANHFLIFDYYRTTPDRGMPHSLCGGVIDPRELQGEHVVVFSSHSHFDHYNKSIFRLEEDLPGIRYLLADDITPPHQNGNVMLVCAHQQYQFGDMSVTTLLSTDLGVAFLVEVDGATIYHAGDLNWWHWDTESQEYNRAMEQNYQREIDTLKGRSVDLAFVVLDPRQQHNALLGFSYFLNTVNCQHVMPIHFSKNIDFIHTQAKLLPQAQQSRLLLPQKRGDCFSF